VRWIVISIAIAAGLVALDRLFLKLEERGWIFYRRNKPNFHNAGSVFLELQAMFDPRARQVIEQKQRQAERQAEDANGDPPVPDQPRWRSDSPGK
jgi:hypothetical protein